MKVCNRMDRSVLPINGLHEFDTLLNHVFGSGKSGGPYVPRTDLVESPTGFVINVEMPGMAAEDVSVEIADDQLTISGEKKTVELDETSTVHRRERVTGRFERSFKFPTHVDFEKVEATSRDGVLTIKVPKAPEVLPRKIEIAVK